MLSARAVIYAENRMASRSFCDGLVMLRGRPDQNGCHIKSLYEPTSENLLVPEKFTRLYTRSNTGVMTIEHLMTAIAPATIISFPITVRHLRALGILGFAKRQRRDDDKRKVLVMATDKGREFVAKLCEAA
jgi:DNA-binding MarR family transcriptional regulator